MARFLEDCCDSCGNDITLEHGGLGCDACGAHYCCGAECIGEEFAPSADKLGDSMGMPSCGLCNKEITDTDKLAHSFEIMGNSFCFGSDHEKAIYVAGLAAAYRDAAKRVKLFLSSGKVPPAEPVYSIKNEDWNGRVLGWYFIPEEKNALGDPG